jgi:transcriptional regulator with XRE-family HTH domain
MKNDNLRKLRLSMDLTQKQMAELLGVSHVTYNRYETGEREISKPVSKLADIISQKIL